VQRIAGGPAGDLGSQLSNVLRYRRVAILSP
jgi:hypothetical protein